MNNEDRLLEILGDWRERRSRGEMVDPEQVIAAHPDLADALRACFATLDALDAVIGEEEGAHGSVLARLSTKEERWRPVVLRDPEEIDTDAPIVRARVGSSGVEGRYQVIGEIARGGVGLVLKGLDLDLGRSVAMKVILDEHRSNRDLLQRFVEEAQIGGQLQHPGIVPVYEIGLQKDRRPYFTMKLVKGRTLSALLSERKDPSQDRARFLSIFDSVCQTVAYAHSRGVIHRDLKPANVMVGAFGEVLVVDWGLGKVLRQGGVEDEKKAREGTKRTVIHTVRTENVGSDSLAGSVIGTLPYMPPEQARGDLSQVDERSDVFSLGATLCEILTGRPPYGGETQQEVLRQAANADLADAGARLDECGADEELVRLARRCLSPAQDARPRNAGELAKEIRDYLSAVEERARRARIEAAEANARAAREEARAARERAAADRARSARRLTLIASAAVVLILGLATASWLVIDGQRRDRESETARLVARELEDAATRKGQAEATDGVDQWERALESSRRAVETARARAADPALLTRAEATEAELAAGLAAAEERAAIRARDVEMVASLDDIRQRAGSQRNPAVWALEAYAAAFAEYGIPVLDLDAAEAARRIDDSRIEPRLLIALHDWRFRLFMQRRSQVLEQIDEVLDRADDDPWRKRLRRTEDLAELQGLRDEVDLSTLSNETALILAVQLDLYNDPEGAARIARDVQRRDPGDYWANTEAGTIVDHLCRKGDPEARREDVVRYFTAALALRPDSVQAAANLGAALREVPGHQQEAAELLRRGFESAPTAQLAVNLSTAVSLSGDLEEALRLAREGLRLEPDNLFAHLALIGLHQKRGDWAAAVEQCRDGLARFQDMPDVRAVFLTIISHTLRSTGDQAGALAAADEVVELFDGGRELVLSIGQQAVIRAITDEPVRVEACMNYMLAWAYYVQHDLSMAIRACEKALSWSPDYVEPLAILAQAYQRRGDYRKAVDIYARAVKSIPDNAAAWGNLGSLARILGYFDTAVHALSRAVELTPAGADVQGRLQAMLTSAEEQIALRNRMWRVVAGADPGFTPRELRDLGLQAKASELPAAAATLWARAYLEDPSLPDVHDIPAGRYYAACAAALAAAGEGKDARGLAATEREHWRGVAFSWLTDELAYLETRLEKDAPGVVWRLEHWKRNPELAGIRDESDLASLNDTERELARALWQGVDDLLSRARKAVREE